MDPGSCTLTEGAPACSREGIGIIVGYAVYQKKSEFHQSLFLLQAFLWGQQLDVLRFVTDSVRLRVQRVHRAERTDLCVPQFVRCKGKVKADIYFLFPRTFSMRIAGWDKF